MIRTSSAMRLAMTGRASPPMLNISNQRGLTLIEVMVSLTIGLLILVFLAILFANTSNTRREIDKAAELFENGRYGLNVLGDELSHAGYYGTLTTVTGTLTTDLPCSTTLTDWQSSLAIPVSGANQDDIDKFDDCIAPKAGTDVIFVQRAATCAAGVAGCAALANGTIYMQVSECGSEYSTTAYVLAAQAGTSPFVLKTKACTAGTLAPIRRFIRRIFFVDDTDTLQYVDVTAGGLSAAVPIASGIENMQIEYGVDTAGDASPDAFESLPADWTAVVGARVWLLSRAPNITGGYTDDKTYTMGDVTLEAADLPGGTGYKRHVFTSYINFVNPQGRKE